jgi:hypothetical protein
MKLVTFTKLNPKGRSAMDHQSLLLSLESLLDVNPLENFKTFFTNLDASHLDSFTSTGRKPFPRESLLRAIIFKNLKAIPKWNDFPLSLKTHTIKSCKKSDSNSSTTSSTSLSLPVNISPSILALFLPVLKKIIPKPMSKTVSQNPISLLSRCTARYHDYLP